MIVVIVDDDPESEAVPDALEDVVVGVGEGPFARVDEVTSLLGDGVTTEDLMDVVLMIIAVPADLVDEGTTGVSRVEILTIALLGNSTDAMVVSSSLLLALVEDDCTRRADRSKKAAAIPITVGACILLMC